MHKIVLFGLDGCPECDTQKRILNDNFGEDWHYIDIDSDYDSDQELMAQYDIDDPPSLLVIKSMPDGKSKVFRHVGIISASKLMKFIDKF